MLIGDRVAAIIAALRKAGLYASFCDVMARLPTDRAALLRVDAISDGDQCHDFVWGAPGHGDCGTDGHYLCEECAWMSPEALASRKG